MSEAPTVLRFSRDEYHRLGEIGMIRPETRTELLDGVIYEMAPIGPGHAWPTTRLQRRLERCAGDAAILMVQQPLALSGDSEPVPDLMLLRADADDRRQPEPPDVLLLIEVSVTTLAYDRVTKAARYAAAGIPDCWVHVVATRQFIVHREPSLRGYADVRTYEAGQPIAPLALPDCPIDPGNLAGT